MYINSVISELQCLAFPQEPMQLLQDVHVWCILPNREHAIKVITVKLQYNVLLGS